MAAAGPNDTAGHDHRNAVLFPTNANGAEFDALIADESASWNADWRGVFRVAARRPHA